MERLILLVVIPLLIQCQHAERPHLPTDQFFDLEIALYTHIDTATLNTVNKSIVYNTEEYTETIPSYNLSRDLAIYETFNINNPNWYDKFDVDTTIQSQKMLIKYAALSDDIDVSECEVRYDDSVLSSVMVQTNKDGLIADLNKKFSWNVKDQVIILEVNQETLIGAPRYFKQELKILNSESTTTY